MIPITIVISDEKLARRIGMVHWSVASQSTPSFLVYCGREAYLWPIDERLIREMKRQGEL